MAKDMFPPAVSYTTPPREGDADLERRQADLVAEVRRTQRVEFAVAPRATLTIAGKDFPPGAEVTRADLSPHYLLRLRDVGVLIHIDRDTVARRSRAATPGGYRVGRRAITSPTGILGPGEPVTAADLATPAVPARTFTDRGGAVITIEAKPASDGTAELAQAVKNGLVEVVPDEPPAPTPSPKKGKAAA